MNSSYANKIHVFVVSDPTIPKLITSFYLTSFNGGSNSLATDK
jgi:hypothetical protein